MAVSRYAIRPRSNGANAMTDAQSSPGRGYRCPHRKGLSARLTLAVPVTLSALSDAEAQTAGMERRQDRREGRQIDAKTDAIRVRIGVRHGAAAEATLKALGPVPAQNSSEPRNLL